MTWLRPLGCASSCLSYTAPCAGPHWSTATTSAQSTCLRTPFSISAPNMWRLIFISFWSALPLVMFVFFTFRRRLSSPTSSPKGYRLRSSRSSIPI
uniref:Uncharacterized protein n=1 Tax=Arundo donax TaxID=35708 RepID=A0A0A8YUJ2_ARUDO